MKKAVLKQSPVDKGWAWVILACAVVSYALAIGGLKCFGLLFTEFLETFGRSTSSTAFIPSIHMAFVHFTGLPANYLTTRFGFKKVVVTGGLLCSIGYLSTAFVPRMEFMFITAAVAGIGVGFVATPTVAITNNYFLNHRAKAVGIVTSSASMIMFGLPHLYRFLIGKYSIRGALVIISGIVLHICVSASLFRQPTPRCTSSKILENPAHETSETESVEMNKLLEEGVLSEKETKVSRIQNARQDLVTDHLETENSDKTEEAEKNSPNKGDQEQKCGESEPTPLQTFNFALIRVPKFLHIAFSYLAAMSGYGIMLIILPAYAKGVTQDSGSSAAVLSSLGGAETISKILIGWLIDKKILTCRTIWSCLLTVAGITAFCTMFARSLVSLCILSALFGATGGGIFILLPQTLVETLGINLLVSGLGLSTIFSGTGNLVSSPLAGFIKDETGSWNGTCILVACLCTCSALIMQTGKMRELCTRIKQSS